ncbi:probable disease resistance protein At4g33300 isoform X2 [Phalaenopsis equestris]|uniref:probable disease resistance protein At4g33300 isoform X2 n=1 Tax=Phalaenopsis equestris TaxID=78828 RepID=UPI0009E31420|nr:probable disease resistance protein At4g33300 isoform X2 [Phalaenopsis equestris]
MDTFVAGEIATELVKELIEVVRRVYLCRQSAEQLRRSVESLLPIITEIRFSGVEHSQPIQKQISDLLQLLHLGLDLARKVAASSRFNVYRSLQLARKMDKVEREINRWIQRQIPVHILADVHHMRVESSVRFDRLERKVEDAVAVGVGEGRIRVLEMIDGLGFVGEREGDVVGVGVRVGREKVKDMLMNAGGGEVVGICGIGGSGKTTMAREICKDTQIRNYFGERIFFETVSQFPNLETLKLKLWEQIGGSMVLGLYKQIPQWQMDLKPRFKQPTLVVLDDVWSQTELEELVFRAPGCKTLVVSRVKFPTIISSTYELELLSEDESLSLFCSSAFGQDSIPPTADKNLVKQVVAECKGLPLALKVIGASLRDQPPKIWVSAKNRLSRGETISESHEIKLLERMATSIECLSGKVKDCFLDLGSFPEDKKIPLDVLINLWMDLHDLYEEDAFAILVELSNRSLLTLVKDTQAGDIYSSYCELSITQHDILRDLALYMNNREPLKSRRRLIMPKREARLPKDWERNHDQPFEAQIVSIHTGEMRESDWPPIKCPKAEVLMINLAAEAYFLPPFVNTMPNLKSLILINYGSSSVVLGNIFTFTSLNNLQSLWFEKITVPPLPRTTIPLQNLRKISLVLCDLRNILKKDSKTDLRTIFPNLSHVSIDHSMDLPELPSTICDMRSLENMSISNCHDLQELPAEIGRLESLQILRVYACPALKKLPESICRLKNLKYLDISQCVNLKDLPDEFGNLSGLEKIDMRECLQLRKIPRSFVLRNSSLHVVCDEDMALLWKERGRELPELKVQVVEECFNLDWLVE